MGAYPLALLWEVIDEYVFHENFVTRNWQLAMYSQYSAMIERAGGLVTDNRIVIVVESPGGVEETELYFEMPQPSPAFTTLEDAAAWMDFIIRDEMIGGDIFFIDFRSFVLGCHIDETAARIEQAIENGVRKFIVDLRDNGGGFIIAGEQLLAAMGICAPWDGGIRRFNPLIINTLRESGRRLPLPFPLMRVLTLFADGITNEPSTHSVNANDVFVSILTNNFTFSAAIVMASWVQDGGFGNIIGAPSGHAPSAFGGVLRFDLPYTRLQVSVSHSRFLRPDVNADQMILWPDIMVDPADALEVAIEYLRGRNR